MKILKLLLVGFFLSIGMVFATKPEKVEFKNQPQNKKVEVYIGGKFFTSYIYPDDMKKQTLYPIYSASGKIITRGYPRNPRPYERADHPHHVGLWFNFGNVNRLDFWNNSFAAKPKKKKKYGSIKFKKIVSENQKKGKLVTLADWVDNEGNVLLNEETTYLFSGKGNLRTIERITKLKAVKKVTFNQSKEGIIGMRLDRAFEGPSEKPEIFLDASGNITEVPVINNETASGVYHNADGITGNDVWGKRSPWVALRANKDGEVITIVLMDYKQNINYPAWSHARGYGLFAANNLGGQKFDKDADLVEVVLETGEQIVFKHKVIIGGKLTDDEINAMANKF
ncbi:hypothetical protein GM418_25790 [Maribellus comscasis]|uniref:Methane oxygenase PmoA n=1 Tax=Maribellus comscasis TaxID=2681766 RepID=A0A6I6K0J4_9BACT|nr:DUF6807 family protein [Maribellus comscasis]QGY46948.1 hypothetical protein GM418_25790 [Maribellus comscasis]